MMDRRQMASFFERLASEMYGGSPVPPAEGGFLFRTVCERCRERGDLFWTESRLHDLARELGYWPWSVPQIEAAMRQQRSSSHSADLQELAVFLRVTPAGAAAGKTERLEMKGSDR